MLLRGGGWASDMFLRYDARRLEDQVRLTRDLGLNMIRMEGKLEHDEFYDLADRYGLLLLPGWECCNKWERYGGWNDEDHRIAAASLYAAAERIRNHPSVAAFLIGSDYAPPARVEAGYLDALERAEWPHPVVSSASRRGSPVLGSSGMKMDGPYDWVPPNYWYDQRLGAAYGFASELSAGPGVPGAGQPARHDEPAELDRLWKEPDAKHYHAARPGSQFESLSIYNKALASRYGTPTSLDDYVRKAQLANYEAIRAQFEAYGGRRDATGLLPHHRARVLDAQQRVARAHLAPVRPQPHGGRRLYGARKANGPCTSSTATTTARWWSSTTAGRSGPGSPSPRRSTTSTAPSSSAAR